MRDDSRPKSLTERLCYGRQIKDLRGIGNNGLEWDEHEAQRAVAFCKTLRHWKGRQFVGKPFEPEAWQEELILAPLFGWRRRDSFSGKSVRRFNEAYIAVPRKNGKSFLASAIASQGLLADNETGPEVYSAASKKEQAGIVFKDCKETLSASPLLAKHLKIRQHFIECPRNGGILRAMSSDYGMVQGRGPSRAIIDELHVHRTSETYDALIGGAGGRQDWIVFMITTAGSDRSSICWDRHEYAQRILEGTIEDDTYLTFIAESDPDADIEDPQTWWQANPNLGVSVFPDFLKKQSRQAALLPSHENEFRRVHLNQWTNQATRWIPLTEWDACQSGAMPSGECHAALDCGHSRDPNVLALLWRDDDRYTVRVWYWMPEDAVDERGEQDKQLLMNWANKGLITKTEGNVADFNGQLPADIFKILETNRVKSLAYDPWSAMALIQRLQAMGSKATPIEYRQNFSTFAAPMREMERLVFSRQIAHNGDPVLRWMLGNVAVKTDSSGNTRPDKGASANKIDGVVATLMALGSWLSVEPAKRSIYEERGVLVL